MVKYIKRIFVPIFMIAFMQMLSLLYAGYNGRYNTTTDLQIKLKPESLIVGNNIMLGEVCEVNILDSKARISLEQISLGLAPPPGEAIEISIASIKKKIKVAGLSKYLPYLIGPKTIRVETVHREIDKAFLHEELAINYFLVQKIEKKV